MHSPLTTVLFDWGGVVADDPGDDFLKQLLAQLGATDTQIQEIMDTYMYRFMRGQISEVEYWSEINRQYGLKIHDSISDEFKKWSGLSANQDVLALIAEVKAKGIRVALLSNVIEPTYNVLEQAGYYDQFDELIASCKVSFAKPQPEIYQLALDKLHVSASESLFIDDKQSNLTPANELGLTTILAKNPAQIITDVRAALEVS
ncbi:MAG TPA: HAD family phosphatase [Candidatus Saccharimonadales bacterium]|nr:HAD family phosphatase [Candidatus Saccharimonadales bacterium]